MGKLHDDSDNRMSPTWARKGSKRWRYYVSQAALHGDKSKAGSVLLVPAADVEELVAEGVGQLSLSDASLANIRNPIDRVVISHATIRIQLQEVADESDGARILTFPWTRPSPYRKREFLQGMPARCPLTRARSSSKPSRCESLAGRTSLRSPPDFGVAWFRGKAGLCVRSG